MRYYVDKKGFHKNASYSIETIEDSEERWYDPDFTFNDNETASRFCNLLNRINDLEKRLDNLENNSSSWG